MRFQILCTFFVTIISTIFALDLDFPPCEQINTALCAAERFRKNCPDICGATGSGTGGAGGGGGAGNGHGAQHGKGPNNDKQKENGNVNRKTTTPKPGTTTTAEDISANIDSNSNKNNNDQSNIKNSDDEEPPTTAPAPAPTTPAPAPATTSKSAQTTRKSGQNTKKESAENKATTKSSSSNSNGGSSNGGSCDKITPCVSQDAANDGFKKRCQDKGIKDTCWDKCRYDISFDELKKAMLGGKCPIAGMRDYLKAASAGNDNRMCCEKIGVLEGKRDFCFPFCNPDGDTWPGPKEGMKYLPCASQMSNIMKCHWAGIKS